MDEFLYFFFVAMRIWCVGFENARRKVALLIDDASSNGQSEDLSSLPNLEIIFLPKNTERSLLLKKECRKNSMNVLSLLLKTKNSRICTMSIHSKRWIFLLGSNSKQNNAQLLAKNSIN